MATIKKLEYKNNNNNNNNYYNNDDNNCNTQQNSKFRLFSKQDEILNHIKGECSKLAQIEYKSKHDWVGKVIYWELCKRLKFDHADK